MIPVYFKGDQESKREQWLAKRREGIAATDIATILGVGYKGTSPQTLAAEKMGTAPAFDVNERMRLGTFLEPFALERWKERRGIELCKGPDIALRDGKIWQTATPDSFTVPDLVAPDKLVEAKAVFQWPGDEWGPDESSVLPIKFATQTQWQMMVCDMAFCEVSVLFVPYFHRVYKVDFDPVLAGLLEDAATEFWEVLKTCKASNIVFPEDWHSSMTLAVTERVEKVNPDTFLRGTEEMEQLAKQITDFKAIKKDAADSADELEEKLLLLIGDASEVAFPGGGYMTRKLVKRAGYTTSDTEYYQTRISLAPKAKKGRK